MLSIKPKVLYVRDPKTGKFIPLLAIRGGKGPPGSIDNITDYLTSETGDSAELAMSQNGVTILLGGIESELENLATELGESKTELGEAIAEIKSELTTITNSLEFLYGNGTLGLEYSIDKDTCSITITSIGYANDNTEIVIPSRIYNVPVTSIGERAFDSSKITSVTIPDSVTSIGDYAFTYCRSLTSITIPDSVTSIGTQAFSFCNNLTSVTIGNGVTSIGEGAFARCSKLASVTIGNGVKSIGDNVFGFTSLTDIYYQGTEAEWEAIDIHESNDSVISAATIHFESSLPEV